MKCRLRENAICSERHEDKTNNLLPLNNEAACFVIGEEGRQVTEVAKLIIPTPCVAKILVSELQTWNW